MVDILKLNLFSEDVYVFAVEEGCIDGRGSAFLETAAADSENLAHAVGSAMDAVLDRKEQLDALSVRYLCLLEKENRLPEFMADEDPVILTTPAGRSVRAKTLGQRVYVDAMAKNDVVICKGPAGSGKTFLGVAMAVLALRERSVSRIILTRPAVEAGEKLGYLPGDIEEKVDPYMRPIYDALLELMGREGFEKNIDRGIIEVSPLAYMRGRNLDDSTCRPVIRTDWTMPCAY